MSNRFFFRAMLVCMAATLPALAQPGTQLVLQYAAQPNTQTQFSAFNADGTSLASLAPQGSALVGPAGIAAAVAVPTGNKYYLLGTAGANSLQSVGSTFQNPSSINGL